MPSRDPTAPPKPAKSRSVSLAELKVEARRRRGILQRITSSMQRGRMPKIKTGEEQVNALWGSNLTWFVGKDGQGLGLGGPPLHAAHLAQHERVRRFTGRSLTRHFDPKGKV